jgi:hypothetical protein
MSFKGRSPRGLQQQPDRRSDVQQQQQQAGSSEFQPKAAAAWRGQMGDRQDTPAATATRPEHGRR